jgi:hypothetical protein
VSAPARSAAACALFLGLFALIFSAGSALEIWPAPPGGGFRGTDLAVGFGFGLVLLVTFLRPRRAHRLG